MRENELRLFEQKFYASRGKTPESYQTIEVVVEAGENLRGYLQFTLMEQRWRSKEVAIDYLKWAIMQLELLPLG